MIKTFAPGATADLYNGVDSKAARKLCPQQMWTIARRKLDQLNAINRLDALKAPPSNHLEKLEKERTGQWAIRINDRFRLCFRWDDGHAYDVEIVDYH